MPEAVSSNQACPKCSYPLVEIGYEGVPILACPYCKGALVPARSMRTLLRGNEADVGLFPPEPDDPSHVHDCTTPECHGQFQTYRINKEYRVAVDFCERCGCTWLDADELPYVQHMSEVLSARKEIGKDFRFFHVIFMLLSQGAPVEFYAKPRKRPVALYALIAINILLFFLTIAFPELDEILVSVPSEPKNPVWFLKLLSSAFDHADVIHLLGNMYFLYIFGDNIEDLLGARKFTLFYLAACLFAGFCHAALTSDPDVPFLGASGGVSAVMCAYLVYCKRAKIVLAIPFLWIWKKTRKISPCYALGFFVVLDMISAFTLGDRDGVGHWAHLGGALFGVVFAKVTYEKVLRDNPFLKYLNTVEK
jgi:membrane associated rhomboid family serine protease/Zn-finger nucleic acid-binding protein